jgi:hypothetical protein
MAKFRFQELKTPHPRPLPTGERRKVRGNARRFALCAMLILFFLPRPALSQGLLQGVSGTMELNYSFLSTKTTDATGTTTKTTSNNFNPRVTLAVNTNIFPNLKLDAGVIFEKNISWFKTDGMSIKSDTTDLRPYINLTLNTPLYTAGIGYDRRQETVKTSVSPGVTTINEDYNVILGWRPEGLPIIDVRLTRTNLFDEKHNIQDTTTDYGLLSARYTYKNLDVRYQGAYTDTKDKLHEVETKDFLHTGRITYSDMFLNNRVSFNGSYNISYEETNTTAAGIGGEVSSQISPFAGLSLVNDTFNPITLDPNPFLIDGNTTTSAGINIGLPPLGGDTSLRQIGLDFLVPTDVNQLLVWVDRDLSSAPTIANSFSWDIYISTDNLNWSHWAGPIHPAPFGPFQNRFELDFPSVSTRYIKVVTKPLSPLVFGSSSFPNIFITELQAFIKKPAEQVKGKTTRLSHILNIDSRAKILNIPTLFYEISYFLNKTDPGQATYTLSNGLSANHRFSSIFLGSARVAREDGTEQGKKRWAYVYNASIVATPLNTLRHNLIYSGRIEEIDKESTKNNSIFLQNNATLYKGIDINLGGGYNFSTLETGQDQRNTIINFGSSIVPHRTTTITLIYSDTTTNQSGGGLPSTSTSTRRGDLSVAYRPFETLYLFASWEILAEKGQKIQTTQNYGLNWSPFPEGTLQFNFSYNESILSENNQKSRLITPSLRWNITSRSFLDLSYQFIHSSSKLQKSDSNGFSANLKIFL